MMVQINYDVPVSATVDIDEGNVEEVLIWSTAIERCDGEHDVVLVGPAPSRAEAADRGAGDRDSQTWPTWQIA